MAQSVAKRAIRNDGRTDRPALRAVPVEEPTSDARTDVVAEILSDGTVRPVAERDTGSSNKSWSEGSLSGGSWILWWTRRSFSQA